MHETVNEKSTAWIEIRLEDRVGALEAPVQIKYRIDCMSTGASILPETVEVSPGAFFELELLPSYNAIRDPANLQELKRLTLVAEYPGGDQLTQQYDWVVNNLTYVS